MRYRKKASINKRILSFISIVVLSFACVNSVAATRVNSDGVEKQNAHELFKKSFGGNPIESQGCNRRVKKDPVRITEVFDDELNMTVFEFYSNVKKDTDCAAGAKDRARVEVKGYNKSSPDLRGQRGEVSVYMWRFKIEDGFLPSKKFTHLFQLKAFRGSDAGAPILTLTPRKRGERKQMQLVYRPSTKSKNVYLSSVDLSPFEGNWVDAVIQVRHKDQGALRVELTDTFSGEVLMSYQKNGIDMYRDGAQFNRPKWGIYRSLEYADQMRDERVRFSDFCIAEGKDSCP